MNQSNNVRLKLAQEACFGTQKFANANGSSLATSNVHPGSGATNNTAYALTSSPSVNLHASSHLHLLLTAAASAS